MGSTERSRSLGARARLRCRARGHRDRELRGGDTPRGQLPLKCRSRSGWPRDMALRRGARFALTWDTGKETPGLLRGSDEAVPARGGRGAARGSPPSKPAPERAKELPAKFSVENPRMLPDTARM